MDFSAFFLYVIQFIQILNTEINSEHVSKDKELFINDVMLYR